MNNKKVIRLSESQLRSIIKESVHSILNETHGSLYNMHKDWLDNAPDLNSYDAAMKQGSDMGKFHMNRLQSLHPQSKANGSESSSMYAQHWIDPEEGWDEYSDLHKELGISKPHGSLYNMHQNWVNDAPDLASYDAAMAQGSRMGKAHMNQLQDMHPQTNSKRAAALYRAGETDGDYDEYSGLRKDLGVSESKLRSIIRKAINEVQYNGQSFHGNDAGDWKCLASEREKNARGAKADACINTLSGKDASSYEKTADKNSKAAKRNRTHAYNMDSKNGKASSDDFHRDCLHSHMKGTKKYNTMHPW